MEFDHLVKKKNDSPLNAVLAGLLDQAITVYGDDLVLHNATDILEEVRSIPCTLSTRVFDQLKTKYSIYFCTKFAPQHNFDPDFEPHSGTEYSVVHKESTIYKPQSGQNQALKNEDFDLDLYIAAIELMAMKFSPHVGEEPSSTVVSEPVVSNSSSASKTELPQNQESGSTVSEAEPEKATEGAYTVTAVGVTTGVSSGFSSRLLPSNYNPESWGGFK